MLIKLNKTDLSEVQEFLNLNEIAYFKLFEDIWLINKTAIKVYKILFTLKNGCKIETVYYSEKTRTANINLIVGHIGKLSQIDIYFDECPDDL